MMTSHPHPLSFHFFPSLLSVPSHLPISSPPLFSLRPLISFSFIPYLKILTLPHQSLLHPLPSNNNSRHLRLVPAQSYRLKVATAHRVLPVQPLKEAVTEFLRKLLRQERMLQPPMPLLVRTFSFPSPFLLTFLVPLFLLLFGKRYGHIS